MGEIDTQSGEAAKRRNGGIDAEESARREMTRDEHAAVKKLIIALCMNYDHEFGCLPIGRACVMFHTWWTRGGCNYFYKAVLPASPALESSIKGDEVYSPDLCAVCGKRFMAYKRQSYCSAFCQKTGNRRKSRERMRKKRLGQV